MLAAKETTRADNFKYKKLLNVCGVVVNKGSKRGFV